MSAGYCSFITITAPAEALKLSRRRLWRPAALLCAAALLAPVIGYAESARLLAQRAAFLAAEQALRQDLPLAERLRASLSSYPLYPYLLARELRGRLENGLAPTLNAELEQYLARYGDTPPGAKLRAAWVTALAAQGRWRTLLKVYRESDTEQNCFYRQGLLYTGREQQALDGIDTVWLQGRSQPASCDPVFERWRRRGGITREHIWERFKLALAANETGLARYLRKRLPAADQARAQRWLNVHAQPQNIANTRLQADDADSAALIVHAIRRWSRRDSVAAAPVWDRLRQRYRVPAGEPRDTLDRRLALFVAARGHPSAARRLAALAPAAVDAEVEEWRVRVTLRAAALSGSWQATLRQLEQMSAPTRDRARWRYWRARALQAGGRNDQAQALYRALAGERDYHGFLAADRLSKPPPYATRHRPLTPPAALLDELQRLPGLQRARELWRLGRLGPARNEWRLASADFDTERRLAAAELAHRWGWHDRAIATAAEAGSWNDLELRFPLPHQDQVHTYAARHGVDPAWAYAVMRQESLFQTDVRSSAGALGLMQLMPGTGQRIAAALNAPRPNRRSLLQVDTNIRFGTYYLRQTQTQLQNNPLLATAAYNAGPGRVKSWLPAQTLPADVWAETIPFKETRRYVQRVMEYAVVYAWRLRQPQQRLSQRMAPVRPRPQTPDV